MATPKPLTKREIDLRTTVARRAFIDASKKIGIITRRAPKANLKIWKAEENRFINGYKKALKGQAGDNPWLGFLGPKATAQKFVRCFAGYLRNYIKKHRGFKFHMTLPNPKGTGKQYKKIRGGWEVLFKFKAQVANIVLEK